MKKVMFQFSVLIVFCFLSMSSSPPLPDQTDNVLGKNVEDEIVLDEYCNYTKTFHVLVANLDILNGVNCDFGQELPLPAEYLPMVFRFQVHDEVEYVEVFESDLFTLNGGCGVFESNTYLFEYTMVVSLYDEVSCGEGDDYVFPLEISSEILTKKKTGGYKPYPICDYTSSTDLFACDFFPETAPFCPHDPETPPGSGVCIDEELASYNYVIDITCGKCDSGLGFNDNGGDNRGNLSSEELGTQDELSFTINPNPFKEKVAIRWNNVAEVPTIKMYDTRGNLLKYFSNMEYKTGEVLEFNTFDLPRGMYIIHVQSGKESKYTKLVKS